MPEAGVEPARLIQPRDFKSLVSTNFTTRAERINGGAGRNRTGVHRVAVDCMATLPPRP